MNDSQCSIHTLPESVRLCACGCGGEVVKSKFMPMTRFRRIRYIQGHGSRKPDGPARLCACGCGGVIIRPKGKSHAKYEAQQYIQGHHFRVAEVARKVSSSLSAAHKRGAFRESVKTRVEKTLSNRPRCKCGCGKPVRAAGAKYAKGCFDATTPENRAIALAARDWGKLSPKYSKRMKTMVKEWRDSGRLEDIKRKAKTLRGLSDHVAANVWIVRDPCGVPYKFSNLSEWARQNEWRFVDDRPHSKLPLWKRIAGGFVDLLKANGRSCSYRGWTAISKLEVNAGGSDLLHRNYVTNL